MRRQLLLLALIAPVLVAFSPLNAAAQTPEAVNVYDEDCRTPKSVFLLGEVVCVRAENFPVFPSNWRERRLQWATPRGEVVQEDDVFNDPRYEYFKIPSSGQYARVGTWTVKTINVDSDGYAVGRFTVRSPLNYFANLELIKVAPKTFLPGSKVSHRIYVYNQGPDGAGRITLTETIPNDMFFLAFRQISGPQAFCKFPPSGEGGQIICEISEITTEDKLDLQFVYGVSDQLRDGDECSGRTEIWSLTDETDKRNNIFSWEGNVYIPPAENPCQECDGE